MAKRKKKPVLLTAPRNPFFNHPLMKKNDVHQKTQKAKRKADEAALKKEWYYPMAA